MTATRFKNLTVTWLSNPLRVVPIFGWSLSGYRICVQKKQKKNAFCVFSSHDVRKIYFPKCLNTVFCNDALYVGYVSEFSLSPVSDRRGLVVDRFLSLVDPATQRLWTSTSLTSISYLMTALRTYDIWIDRLVVLRGSVHLNERAQPFYRRLSVHIFVKVPHVSRGKQMWCIVVCHSLFCKAVAMIANSCQGLCDLQRAWIGVNFFFAYKVFRLSKGSNLLWTKICDMFFGLPILVLQIEFQQFYNRQGF